MNSMERFIRRYGLFAALAVDAFDFVNLYIPIYIPKCNKHRNYPFCFADVGTFIKTDVIRDLGKNLNQQNVLVLQEETSR